jgi:two-component system KDP operon response regulator KdpE
MPLTPRRFVSLERGSAVKVLIVEDTTAVAEVVEMCFAMRWPGVEVFKLAVGAGAAELVQREHPDVVMLDLGLPDMDGQQVLSRIREFSQVPVLILTGEDTEATRVRGLEGGADDYIVKPFSHIELLARVRAVLRRSGAAQDAPAPAGPVSVGPLTVDVEGRMATVHGAPAHLTPTEWNLLTFFLRNRGRVVTHEVLAERVWGSAHVDRTVIKAAVRRLRAKLGDESATPTLIHTHRGTGYRLTDDGGAD